MASLNSLVKWVRANKWRREETNPPILHRRLVVIETHGQASDRQNARCQWIWCMVILDYACILHALSNIKSRTRIDRKHTRKLIVERTSWNPRDASYLIQKKNPIVRK